MPTLDDPREEAFARLMACGTFSQGKAAVKAGYATDSGQSESAWSRGSKLMDRPEIVERIRELTDKRLKRYEVSADKLVAEAAKIAFFDPSELFDEDGSPLALEDISPEARAAIAGLEVFEEFEGRGFERKKTGTVRKWKIADKLAAIQLLMRHKGMLTDQIKHSFDWDALLATCQDEDELKALRNVIQRALTQTQP